MSDNKNDKDGHIEESLEANGANTLEKDDDNAMPDNEEGNEEEEEDEVEARRKNVRKVLKKVGLVVGGTAAGVTAVAAVPVVVGALGFTSAGVAAGSAAASMMSAAATTGVGGACIAMMQSIGAAGLSAATYVTGGAVGTAVGSLASHFTGRKKKQTAPDIDGAAHGDNDVGHEGSKKRGKGARNDATGGSSDIKVGGTGSGKNDGHKRDCDRESGAPRHGSKNIPAEEDYRNLSDQRVVEGCDAVEISSCTPIKYQRC